MAGIDPFQPFGDSDLRLRFSITYLALCVYPAIAWSSSEWDISSVEEIQSDAPISGVTVHSKVLFTNQVEFVIPQADSTPIAVLHQGNGSSYLAALGRECVQCDENLTIRFFALSKPEIVQIPGRFENAGTIRDYLPSNELLDRIRVFSGACVVGPNEVLVWFHDYKSDDGDWVTAKYFTEFDGDVVQLTNVPPDRESTLLRTDADDCIELDGSERFAEP